MFVQFKYNGYKLDLIMSIAKYEFLWGKKTKWKERLKCNLFAFPKNPDTELFVQTSRKRVYINENVKYILT